MTANPTNHTTRQRYLCSVSQSPKAPWKSWKASRCCAPHAAVSLPPSIFVLSSSSFEKFLSTYLGSAHFLTLMFSLSGLPADFLIASCNEYDSNVAHDHHQVILRLQYISSSRACVQDRCDQTHCAFNWALAATIYDQCPPELLTPSSPTQDTPIPGSPLPPLPAIAPCPYLIFWPRRHYLNTTTNPSMIHNRCKHSKDTPRPILMLSLHTIRPRNTRSLHQKVMHDQRIASSFLGRTVRPTPARLFRHHTLHNICRSGRTRSIRARDTTPTRFQPRGIKCTPTPLIMLHLVVNTRIRWFNSPLVEDVSRAPTLIRKLLRRCMIPWNLRLSFPTNAPQYRALQPQRSTTANCCSRMRVWREGSSRHWPATYCSALHHRLRPQIFCWCCRTQMGIQRGSLRPSFRVSKWDVTWGGRDEHNRSE